MQTERTTATGQTGICAATVRAFREQYGVLAWYGEYTGHWWAIVGTRLLEAQHPNGLAQLVRRALGWER
jgi:hypothetical protein